MDNSIKNLSFALPLTTPVSLRALSLLACSYPERLYYYRAIDDLEDCDELCAMWQRECVGACKQMVSGLVDALVTRVDTSVLEFVNTLLDNRYTYGVNVAGSVAKVSTVKPCGDRLGFGYMHQFGCELCDVHDVCALMKAGDVESNPGPSVNPDFLPPPPRYNCYRGGVNRMSGGYRLRSDPDERLSWFEREMRKAERDFHGVGKSSSEQMGAIVDAVRVVVDQISGEGNVAQIFGLDVKDILGVGNITASVDRAVDVASQNAAVMREDLANTFRQIPTMIGSMLDAQAGFLPMTIRTVLVCVVTLAALYVVRRLMRVSYEFFSLLYSLVKTIFSECVNVFACFDEWMSGELRIGTAQVGGDMDAAGFVSEWAPKVIPLMMSMLVAGSLKKLPSKDNSPDAWMRRLELVPRACKGFGNIHSFVTEWLQKAVAYARELMYGVDPLDEKHGLPAVSQWMESVVEVSKELSTVCRTRAGCERVKNLWYRGDRLLKEYRSVLDRDTVDNVKRMLQLAARMRETAMNTYGRPKGVRAVPQLVWLVGESQIGKSTMQYFLAAELLAEFGMAKDIEDQMYMRAIEQEYADGYNGQYVWVIDDAFQMKDSAGSPNIEFFEIIRAVGNFPYALHMADISQKANTYFDSKSLICSTNNAELDIQSLTYPDAVLNRFAFAYHVRIKAEYQKLKQMHGQDVVTLDVEKAKRDAPVVDGVKQMFNLNVYEFVRFDPCNPDRIDEPPAISFQELARVLREDLRKRDGQSTGLSAMLRQYATRLDEEHNAAVAQVGSVDSFVTCSGGDGPRLTPRNFFDGKEIGRMTLGQLISAWEKVRSEEDTPQNGLQKLDALLVLNELETLDCPLTTQLRDIAWEADVITPPEVVASVLFARDQVDSVWTKFQVMAERLLQRWCVVKEHIKQAYDRLAVPLFEAAVSAVKKVMSQPLLVFGLVLGGCYLARPRSSDPAAESDTRAQQPRSRPFTVLGARKAFTRARRAENGEVEMAEDASQQMVIGRVRRNQFSLHVTCKDGSRKFYGNGTIVSGAVMMIPYHFVVCMRDVHEVVTVHLTRHDTVEGFDIAIETFLRDAVWQEEHDLAFVNLFGLIPNRGRIVSHFASRARATRLFGTFKATLSGYRMEDGRHVLSNMKGNVTPVDSVSYKLDNTRMLIREVYEYDIDTMKGDCGMILTVCDSASEQKILGMHVAGSSTGRNWATAVWREVIEDALAEFDSVAQMAGSYSELPPCEMNVAGEFLPVGLLEDGPLEMARSCIVPSTLHGKLSVPVTKPAYLKPFVRDGVRVDPLELGVKKAGAFIPLLDQAKIDVAGEDVLLRLSENHRDEKVALRVLSYEEAVSGIAGDDLLNGISRVTSPGYPYTKTLRRGKGKTMWMGSEEYEFDSDAALALRQDVEDLINRARNGERLDVLWIDTLKDERRPIEKVEEGKTRVFSNGPMHFNIAFRKYFLSAFAHIQNNRIFNSIAVGMNVWSAEWEQLYRHLTVHGKDTVIDGDFGNLDGTLSAAVLWKVEEILDRLYDDGEENSRIRKALWTVVVYASRYYRGQVYQCTHSVPSGVPGTSIIDSIALMVCFRMLWLDLAPVEMRSMMAFNDNVSMIVYGDDNVLGISPPAAEFYNMETLVEAFKKIGMKYTDAGKTGEVVRLKTIDDVQFLKRRFVWSPFLARHTCPADLESRLESLNWTRKNNVIDTRVIERDVIQNVFQEIAAFSDKALFEQYATKILRAARECNMAGVVNEGFLYYHIPREERM
nr:MAG: structural polyprotein [Crogonang virus 3]